LKNKDMANTVTKYFEGVGRRKTAIARVRLTESSRQTITINDKKLDEYFATDELRARAMEALKDSNETGKFSVVVKVVGGGQSAQAEAVRHGSARALVEVDANLRRPLKLNGYLTRDPRAKERRKFGLKKARKAGQWSKR
jgi:small subunit ribosomal protein S9